MNPFFEHTAQSSKNILFDKRQIQQLHTYMLEQQATKNHILYFKKLFVKLLLIHKITNSIACDHNKCPIEIMRIYLCESLQNLASK